MPKVKRSKKPPPDGWELIEPTLDELDQKMREGISSECSIILSELGRQKSMSDNRSNTLASMLTICSRFVD